MNRKPRRATVAAFTLVEVMIAAVVMLLALVGTINVMAYGFQMLDVSRKQTIAMQIIHGQIDNIRLTDWSIVNGSGYSSPITVNVDASNQSSNIAAGFVFGPTLPTMSKDFRCKREVSSVSGRTDMKQVKFSVTWRGNTGRSYTRSASTYVGKNGLYATYKRP